MKKRYTVYLTEETYKKYKLMCLLANTNVSKELDNFIKEEVNKCERKN